MTTKIVRYTLAWLFLVVGTSYTYAAEVVHRPPQVNPVILTPSTTVPAVTLEQWDKSPVCPAVTQCPTANCPDNCRVTRDPEQVPNSGYIPMGTLKSARCPSGYVSAGAFNMQAEVKYQVPQYFVPVNGLSFYHSIKDLPGVHCSQGYQLRTRETCKYMANAKVSVNTIVDNFPNMPNVIGAPSGSKSNTVIYVEKVDKICWCAGCNIKGCPTCDAREYEYFGRPISCSQAEGLYPTGRAVPVSLYCVRVETTWREK